MNKDLKIKCLMGPTASGKTATAFEWVDQYNMEIISVDSAMVYRDMNIGTAKPDRHTLKNYPHRLVDILDPTEAYSAADFKCDCEAAIEDILQKGKEPLLVGGTMLYFKALQQGLSELPEADAALRAEIGVEANEKGWAALHDELKQVDPESAEKIHPNDPQRLQRALEVYRLTGKTRTELWREQTKSPKYQFENIAIIPVDRAVLHQRIAQRFHQMLEQGFLDEVKALREKYDLTLDHPSMRAVGYRQAWLYLDGELSFDEFVEKGVAATRQLAKRQLTWLRSMDITRRISL